MLAVETVLQAAQELGTGPREASIKLALWAAVLSPNKLLSWNIAQVEALRPYVESKRLPDDSERVWRIIRRGHKFASRRDAENVLGIEKLDRMGALKSLERKPRTSEDWDRWRRVAASVRGLSWKTASFAALLLWPLECPLVPVDRHVLSRLGLEHLKHRISAKNNRAYARYKAVEYLVSLECQAYGERVPLGIWHWVQWSTWRQLVGAEVESDSPQSHAGLSPYRY